MAGVNAWNIAEALVSYARNCGWLEEDCIWARNTLLALCGADGCARETEPALELDELDAQNPELLLSFFAKAAEATGALDAGDTFARETLCTQAMNALMPHPSQVQAEFARLMQAGNPQAACDYLYRISCESEYVHERAAHRNLSWEYTNRWGALEITINRAKPEKDPRAIAAAGAKPAPTNKYPICALCLENEGYAGRAPEHDAGGHAARQNLRYARISLDGKPWGLQFSPYSYYEQHCIVINREHRPMRIDAHAFGRLLEFAGKFPQYFVGSNADLPHCGRFHFESRPFPRWGASVPHGKGAHKRSIQPARPSKRYGRCG